MVVVFFPVCAFLLFVSFTFCWCLYKTLFYPIHYNEHKNAPVAPEESQSLAASGGNKCQKADLRIPNLKESRFLREESSPICVAHT